MSADRTQVGFAATVLLFCLQQFRNGLRDCSPFSPHEPRREISHRLDKRCALRQPLGCCDELSADLDHTQTHATDDAFRRAESERIIATPSRSLTLTLLDPARLLFRKTPRISEQCKVPADTPPFLIVRDAIKHPGLTARPPIPIHIDRDSDIPNLYIVPLPFSIAANRPRLCVTLRDR